MKIIALLVLLVLTSLSSAQQQIPVIVPEDIFTEAVTVVETLPVVEVDNEQRWLYYFDPSLSRWRLFRYPDEIIEFIGYHTIKRRSDNTYLLEEENFRSGDSIWIFNPHDGGLALPPMVCGVIQDLSGEGRWVQWRNPETQKLHFCFSENGELTSELPAEFQFLLSEKTPPHYGPFASPDKHWLVLSDDLQHEALHAHKHRIFAYNLKTEAFVFLGQGLGEDHVRVDRWLDATSVILLGYSSPSWSSKCLYRADITEANSLSLITCYNYATPTYFDNPPRYIWSEGNPRYSNLYLSSKSSLTVEYDLTTNEAHIVVSVGCKVRTSYCSIVPNNQPDGKAEIDPLIAIFERPNPASNIEVTHVYNTNYEEALFEEEGTGQGWWIDSNRLLLESSEIITLENNEISKQSLGYPVLRNPLSPNREHILIETEIRGIGLFHIPTGEITPIIKPLNYENYIVNAQWREDGSIEVILRGGSISDYFVLGSWIIQIKK